MIRTRHPCEWPSGKKKVVFNIQMLEGCSL